MCPCVHTHGILLALEGTISYLLHVQGGAQLRGWGMLGPCWESVRAGTGGDQFSSKISAQLWAWGLQAAPLHAASLHTCVAGCREDRPNGGTKPIPVPGQHLSPLLQPQCLSLRAGFPKTSPSPSPHLLQHRGHGAGGHLEL